MTLFNKGILMTMMTYEINSMLIIIKSHRASRHIRPPRCLTNTFCFAQPLVLPSSSTQLCFALSRLSFSKYSFWSSSCPPSGVQPNAVKQSFSPSFLSMWPSQFHHPRRTSQLISLMTNAKQYFILKSLGLTEKNWQLTFRNDELYLFTWFTFFSRIISI